MKITQKKKVSSEPAPQIDNSQCFEGDYYEEESFLGFLLLSEHLPSDIDIIFSFLLPDDFEREDHRILYEASMLVYQRTGNISFSDLLRVVQKDLLAGVIDNRLLIQLSSVIIFESKLEQLVIAIKKKNLLRSLQKTVIADNATIFSEPDTRTWFNNHTDKLRNILEKYELNIQCLKQG